MCKLWVYISPDVRYWCTRTDVHVLGVHRIVVYKTPGVHDQELCNELGKKIGGVQTLKYT